MKVKFWGVRGSIASPGPATAYYGGTERERCRQVSRCHVQNRVHALRGHSSGGQARVLREALWLPSMQSIPGCFSPLALHSHRSWHKLAYQGGQCPEHVP